VVLVVRLPLEAVRHRQRVVPVDWVAHLQVGLMRVGLRRAVSVDRLPVDQAARLRVVQVVLLAVLATSQKR
jgi:hypothetical protein